MIFDILDTNREQVGEMLQRYRRQLNRLIGLVENGHESVTSDQITELPSS